MTAALAAAFRSKLYTQCFSLSFPAERTSETAFVVRTSGKLSLSFFDSALAGPSFSQGAIDLEEKAQGGFSLAAQTWRHQILSGSGQRGTMRTRE